jgi:hypothetical protein
MESMILVVNLDLECRFERWYFFNIDYRLFGLVVRVPGYRSRGLGLNPGATRFSEE